MPAAPVAVRKARAARLREAGQDSAQAYYRSLLGKELNVLMETVSSGHSEQFAPVRLVDGAVAEVGHIERLRAVAVDADGLVAERV